jgi:hypothetical protein
MHTDGILEYRRTPYRGRFGTLGHGQRLPGIDRIEGGLPRFERTLRAEDQKCGHNRWQSATINRA